jgi:hypothetical protein
MLAALRFAYPKQVERQRHILFDRQIGQNMKGLEDKADGTPAQQRYRIIVQGGEVDALEQHAAAVGSIESGQQVEQR